MDNDGKKLEKCNTCCKNRGKYWLDVQTKAGTGADAHAFYSGCKDFCKKTFVAGNFENCDKERKRLEIEAPDICAQAGRGGAGNLDLRMQCCNARGEYYNNVLSCAITEEEKKQIDSGARRETKPVKEARRDKDNCPTTTPEGNRALALLDRKGNPWDVDVNKGMSDADLTAIADGEKVFAEFAQKAAATLKQRNEKQSEMVSLVEFNCGKDHQSNHPNHACTARCPEVASIGKDVSTKEYKELIAKLDQCGDKARELYDKKWDSIGKECDHLKDKAKEDCEKTLPPKREEETSLFQDTKREAREKGAAMYNICRASHYVGKIGPNGQPEETGCNP